MPNTPTRERVRLNITMPKSLVKALRKEVSTTGKSKFIAEAVEEKMARLRREQALKALEKLPPALPHIKDSATFISELRSENEERANRLGI